MESLAHISCTAFTVGAICWSPAAGTDMAARQRYGDAANWRAIAGAAREEGGFGRAGEGCGASLRDFLSADRTTDGNLSPSMRLPAEMCQRGGRRPARRVKAGAKRIIAAR